MLSKEEMVSHKSQINNTHNHKNKKAIKKKENDTKDFTWFSKLPTSTERTALNPLLSELITISLSLSQVSLSTIVLILSLLFSTHSLGFTSCSIYIGTLCVSNNPKKSSFLL